MDRERLKELRGLVIEQFINLEIMVSTIICQHYFSKVREDFLLEVLYDEYCSFGLKRRILEKIIKKSPVDFKQKSIDDLNRLNTIRNYFSHCGIELLPTTAPSADDKGKFPDPRALDKELDFESLYKEFCSKEPPVSNYLAELMKKKGIALTR